MPVFLVNIDGGDRKARGGRPYLDHRLALVGVTVPGLRSPHQPTVGMPGSLNQRVPAARAAPQAALRSAAGVANCPVQILPGLVIVGPDIPRGGRFPGRGRISRGCFVVRHGRFGQQGRARDASVLD